MSQADLTCKAKCNVRLQTEEPDVRCKSQILILDDGCKLKWQILKANPSIQYQRDEHQGQGQQCIVLVHHQELKSEPDVRCYQKVSNVRRRLTRSIASWSLMSDASWSGRPSKSVKANVNTNQGQGQQYKETCSDQWQQMSDCDVKCNLTRLMLDTIWTPRQNVSSLKTPFCI